MNPPAPGSPDAEPDAVPDGLPDGLTGLSDLTVVTDTSLAELTTLRIGGRPRALLECGTAEAVTRAVGILDEAGVPVLVLGGGSNLVVADGDLPMVVVAVRNRDVVYREDVATDDVTVRAGAGLTWDDLVADTVSRGYGGLECLSGIPGSVGATPVQNVGAYGVEVASVLRRVRLYDRASRTDTWVAPAELGLAYRTSVLKNSDRAVVLEVEFALRVGRRSEPVRYAELADRLGVEPGERADAAQVRETVLGLRRGKGMVLDDDDEDTWSAGSFFTNPVVPSEQLADVRERVAGRLGTEQAERMPAFETPAGSSAPGGDDARDGADAPGGFKLSAGWLIERAGFGKGYPSSSSPVRLSTKHTLALTNRGEATADDVIALAREVRDGVREAFGVELRPEPVWVGCAI